MERIDALAAERGLQRRGRLPGAVEVERRGGARRLGAGRRRRGEGRARSEAGSGRLRGRGAARAIAFDVGANVAGATLHQSTAATSLDGQRPRGARSLFDCAEQLGVRVPTSCQKNGKCKECIVEVTRGRELLSPPTEARSSTCRGHFRLSCQCDVVAGRRRSRVPHDAPRPDAHRAACARPAARGTKLPLDPAVTRDGDRILLDGEEIDRSTGPIHGIAMDLGTTTIVLRLINLETGELVADASFENPQRFGGSDVMSRIHYDTSTRAPADADARGLPHARDRGVSGRSAVDLRDGRRRQLDDARHVLPAERLLDRPEPVPVDHRDRDGGGQAHHDEPGRDRAGVCCCRSIRRRASTALPIISGHVGADAAACMLAIDLAHEDRLVAVMDIGTNTELILGNSDRILAASCPAGPAFEGGAISCGMPGLDGAIEDRRDRRRRHVSTSASSATARPRGICGSGLVDSDERTAAHRADERDGALRGRRGADHARRRRPASTSSKATSTSWRRRRAPTSPGCRSSSTSSASTSTTSTCSTSPAGSGGTCASRRRSASG